MEFLIGKEEKANREKLSRLYQSYQQRLFYFAVQILKDPMAAEDAVQDTFLRVRSHLDHIDEKNPHKTGALLYIVVKHIAFDCLKRQKKVIILPVDEVEKLLTKDQDSLEDEDSSEDGDSSFEEAFRKLSFEHRAVLQLRYDQCLPYSDIAQVLDLSEATVRKRCSRAKKRLEVLMERGSDHEKKIG